MFNKTIVFGLVAAGLMIAPTAAFAGSDQSQTNVQSTEQNGAATNGSTNAQQSNSVNVQKQISNIKSRTHVGTPGASQAQSSDQATGQNGAADNGSVNAQTSNTVNHQIQNSNIRKNHRINY